MPIKQNSSNFFLFFVFVQGGTGIIFSSSLLRSVAPKLQHCLTHLYTEHEDVELGRCVHRSTGANCTTSWETSEVFHQEFKTSKGHMTNFEDLNLGIGVSGVRSFKQ